MFRPIEWLGDGKVRFLDQTLLPNEEVWVETGDYHVIAQAIHTLQLRGAPLIGISAAYGLALAALSSDESNDDTFRHQLLQAADELASTRPTAVNLTWSINRMLATADAGSTPEAIRSALVEEARLIHEEDIEANRRIGAYGAELLRGPSAVLTHCNAGALATGGYGTALGIVRAAFDCNQLRHVFTTETRPLLQGLRLTAWELARDEIPFTTIVDGAAGSVLRRGLINAVIVGADRIVANGDVANKIGTYPIAVLANANGVPFYVAAPTSTIDLSLPIGDDIPIEERSPDEVMAVLGASADKTPALNLAFDVTPNTYVTAIITENGVAKPPFEDSLRRLCGREAQVRG